MLIVLFFLSTACISTRKLQNITAGSHDPADIASVCEARVGRDRLSATGAIRPSVQTKHDLAGDPGYTSPPRPCRTSHDIRSSLCNIHSLRTPTQFKRIIYLRFTSPCLINQDCPVSSPRVSAAAALGGLEIS